MNGHETTCYVPVDLGLPAGQTIVVRLRGGRGKLRMGRCVVAALIYFAGAWRSPVC